ncbi:hypothetical protein GGI12_001721 [Dipsacomyces acuminosporus]|nr:hypothetical protein GGI12_001721 [Dipsacomyces acuminosporus]
MDLGSASQPSTLHTEGPHTVPQPVSKPLDSGNRVSNPTKEAWILHSLNKRRSEFISNSSIRAFVGTWNVNGRAPADSSSLAEWLGFVPENSSQVIFDELPELIVLGFQELDARAEAFVYNDAAKDGEWTDAIEKCMGDTRYSYSKLESRQLIGMFIMVYSRIDVLDCITDVQATSVGCGIMGMVGNKGAVAVRLVYKDTPVCFVCSHLAHDAAQLDRRNAQFHDLCRRLQFSYRENVPVADPLIPQGMELVGTGRAVGSGRPLSLFDHSYLLWFGDLNYRLAISTDDVHGCIARGDYEALLGLDQLRIAILNKQAFAGFEEADIKFAPTYKYNIGSNEYDEKRTPAWCDRVLWWTLPGCEGGVRSTAYESVDQLSISDHKPVRSMLAVDVWKVNVERRQSVYLDVLRELDRYENECIPIATLGSTVVDFGQVRFGKLVQRRMDLTNSGQVPLEYSFIATPSREHFAPAWLRIVPESGMLLPGQKLDLLFSVFVDERISTPLATRAEELNDILILHLNRGRDYFVQVQGEYQPSVYGMSMDVLVHCKRAVRTMSREDFEQCLNSGQFSVPKCIWVLTDFLSKYGIDRGYSLFYWKGDPVLADTVKECLDNDAPLNPGSILQWQGPPDDHVPRTAVDEPGQMIIGDARSRGPAADRQPTSRMSMTDQTLVSSALLSTMGDMEASPVPNTTEAFERLSLGPWNGARASALNPEASEHNASVTNNAAEPLGESGNSRHSTSDSDSIPAEHAASATLLLANPASLANSDGVLAGSPLPEAIASAAMAAPHDIGVDTAATCLVDLLRSLPEPLIPTELYSACIEAGGISRAAALEALEVLPPGNLNVLLYLLAFLRVAISKGAASTQCVAHVFARALLRPPQGKEPAASDADKAEAFVSFLLRSHGDI